MPVFFRRTPNRQRRRPWSYTSGAAAGINGSLDKTLGNLTLSAAGQLPIAGNLTKTLANLTVEADGQLPITGTLTKTLANLTVEADGQLPITGTLSKTLGAVTTTRTTITDTFTDADSTSLADHTPEIGGPWTAVTGTPSILSNAARLAAGDSAVIDATISDLTLQVNVKPNHAGAQAYVLFRYQNTNNYWAINLDPNNDLFLLIELTAGEATTRDSASVGIAAGVTYAVKLTANGNNISAWLDGANELNYTSSAHATETEIGLRHASFSTADFDTLSVTTGAPATGTVQVAGQLTKTLAALTPSAAGTVKIDGTTTKTLANLTSSTAGSVQVAGSLAKTLGELTLDATGTAGDAITGSLQKTLANLTQSAAGTVKIDGTTTKTLANLTSSTAGSVQVAGSLAKTLAQLTLEATATGADVTGSLAKTFQPLTAAGTGTVQVHGTTTKTLAPATSEADATVNVSADLDALLATIAAQGQGTVTVHGSLLATLQTIAIDATGQVITPGAFPPPERTYYSSAESRTAESLQERIYRIPKTSRVYET